MDINLIESAGVKYFYNVQEKAVTDIEVKPDVTELELKYDLKMLDSKKSFPDVKKLIIREYVWDIDIPNTLFPNVHGKAELDAAGFIRAEENDKRTHIKNS